MIKGTLERPEKWETCLNVLKYEPDRILLTHKCPGSRKRKGELVLDKQKCEDCQQWRGWREKTDKELLKIKTADCKYCKYASKMESQNSAITCNYIGITGHKRPCLPGNCRAAGVFLRKR